MPTTAQQLEMALDIFRHFDAKPGQLIATNSFAAVADNRGWDVGDVHKGLGHAVVTGLVLNEPIGSYKLTELGYKKMNT